MFRIVLAALFLAAPAFASDQCDRLGALEADPMSVGTPVAFSAIDDPYALIAACSKALDTSGPHSGRFLLQRARGYLRAGEGTLAIKDINAAHQMGYPAATFALATANYLGDDVPQDFDRARALFEISYAQGVVWAAKGLSMLYDNAYYEGYDPQKSADWLLKFEE